MYILAETGDKTFVPTNIKKLKEKVRMECVLQTADDFNRNRRRYSKSILEAGIDTVKERIKEGSFLGELDHPISDRPARQVTVLFKEASHRILETGWDSNKLIGIIETLRTPNGTILKNLVEDGLPVGYSFRGMGDLRNVQENGRPAFDVHGPLHVVTWDAVSFPSHKEAKVIRITEGVTKEINEHTGVMIHEKNGILHENGLVCTNEGICYFPNDFDRLVEQRIIHLMDKFRIDSTDFDESNGSWYEV